MKHLKLVAVLGLVALLEAPSAFAGVCANVEIHVHDQMLGEVKLVDVDYYDYNSDEWREENFVANEVISGDYQFERDLEYVDGELIRIRAHYKYRSSPNNPWSEFVYNASSGPQYCQDGDHFDIHIEDLAHTDPAN